MSTIHTTITDLIDQEIIPALDGVSDQFDLDAFVEEMCDRDMIKYFSFPGESQRNGFRLTCDTEDFWALVEQVDTYTMHTKDRGHQNGPGEPGCDQFVIENGLGLYVDDFQVETSEDERPYDEALAAAGWQIDRGHEWDIDGLTPVCRIEDK